MINFLKYIFQPALYNYVIVGRSYAGKTTLIQDLIKRKRDDFLVFSGSKPIDSDDIKDKVIVIDDFQPDCTITRELLNNNFIIAAQGMYGLQSLRDRIKYLFLFRGLDQNDLRKVHSFCKKGEDFTEFARRYDELTNEPYSYMVLNMS